MRKQFSIKRGFIQFRNLVLHLGQIYLNVMVNAQASGFEQGVLVHFFFWLIYFSCSFFLIHFSSWFGFLILGVFLVVVGFVGVFLLFFCLFFFFLDLFFFTAESNSVAGVHGAGDQFLKRIHKNIQVIQQLILIIWYHCFLNLLAYCCGSLWDPVPEQKDFNLQDCIITSII